MRPSDPSFAHILAEGNSVYLFAEQRIFGARYGARVTAVKSDRVDLELDPDDARDAKLKVGKSALLGIAVASQQTHFAASVKVVGVESESVISVSHPRSVKKWPRRSYIRAPLQLSCELTLAEPGGGVIGPVAGRTTDVSGSGARIELETPLGDEELRSGLGSVRLFLPERDPIDARCSVARVAHRDERGLVTSLAVQYTGLRESDEMQIHLFALRATARRFLRAEASLTCRLELRGGAAPRRYEGVTKNVSASGLLVRFAEDVPVAPGDIVSLGVSLPERHLIIPDAEIVRSYQVDGSAQIAVELGELSEIDRESLILFVVEQIRGVSDAASPSPGEQPLGLATAAEKR